MVDSSQIHGAMVDKLLNENGKYYILVAQICLAKVV